MMRNLPHHEDLGLDPEADRTEDLRPGKSDDPSAGTPRPSEPSLTRDQENTIMTDTTDSHQCPFDWCSTTSNDDTEHWHVIYHPATARYGGVNSVEQPPRVGIGVSYDEGQMPEIVVHLDGGRNDYDADAFLTIQEARQLIDALSLAADEWAIEAVKHLVAGVIRGDDE